MNSFSHLPVYHIKLGPKSSQMTADLHGQLSACESLQYLCNMKIHMK